MWSRSTYYRLAASAVVAGLTCALSTPAVLAKEQGTTNLEPIATLLAKKAELIAKRSSTTDALEQKLLDLELAHPEIEEAAQKEFLITLNSEEALSGMRAELEQSTLTVLAEGRLSYLGFWVKGSLSDLREALPKLNTKDHIATLSANTTYTPKSIQKSPSRKKRDIYSNEMIYASSITDAGRGKLIAVIDGGIDVSSPAFQELADVTSARIAGKDAQAALVASLGVKPGRYVNSKLAFVYNYAEDVADHFATQEHGTHVAGIVAGKPDAAHAAATGVLPEAQLVFMGIGASNGALDTKASLLAIEDAVRLKVDSINMSWGSAIDPEAYPQEVKDALKKASSLGIVCTMAAGNSSAVGEGAPISVLNADYGVPNSPSDTGLGLSVASVANTHQLMRALELADGTIVPVGSAVNLDDARALFDRDLPVVSIPGVGEEADYQGKEVTGAAVVVARGRINFSEKARIAREKGAKLLIIQDYEDLVQTTPDMQGETLPTVMVGHSAVEHIIAAGQLRLSAHETAVEAPDARLMSDFSSWKTDAHQTGTGIDITAPGGSIYSAVAEGRFASEQGTSMAAPHVAAVAAVVKDRARELLEAKKNAVAAPYTEGDVTNLSRQLMMSYATPLQSTKDEASAYVSPRKQGAGLVDVKRALAGDVVLVGDAQKSSSRAHIEGNTLTFTVTLKNYGDKARTFSYTSSLITDEIKDNKLTFMPKAEFETDAQSVSVPAWGEAELSISIDISRIEKPEATQGYFVDGFLKLQDTAADTHISLPFSAYRGDFDALPPLEESVYDLLKRNLTPTYYGHMWDTADVLKPAFTHLSTTKPAASGFGEDTLVLGSIYTKKDGATSFELTSFDGARVAISPNGDGYHDRLIPNVTILRSTHSIYAEILDAAGASIERVPGLEESLTKNSSSVNAEHPQLGGYTELSGLRLDNAQDLPDGSYTLRLHAKAEFASSDHEQILDMPFIVDRVAPSIWAAKLEGNTYTIEDVRDSGAGVSHIWLESASGKKSEVRETILSPEDWSQKSLSFSLPEGATADSTTVLVEDFAGNVRRVPLQNSLVNRDAYAIVLDDPQEATRALPLRYEVRDSAGRELAASELTNLTPGSYTVHVQEDSVPRGYRLSGESTQTVTLDEQHKQVHVSFSLEKLKLRRVHAIIRRGDGFNEEIAPELVNVTTGERVALDTKDSFDMNRWADDVLPATYHIEDTSLGAGHRVSSDPELLVVESSSSTEAVTLTIYYDMTSEGTGPEEPEATGKLYIMPSAQNEYTGLVKLRAVNVATNKSYDLDNDLGDGNFGMKKYDLPAGTYHFKLVDMPSGYKAADQMLYEIELPEGSHASFAYTLVEDLWHKARINLNEQDVSDEVRAAGVRYILSYGSEQKSLDAENPSIVVNVRGYEKTYSVRAEGVPAGYELDESSQTLVVEEGKVNQFTPHFVKQDASATDQPVGETEARIVLDLSNTDLSAEDLANLRWSAQKSFGAPIAFTDNKATFSQFADGFVSISVEGLPEGVRLVNGENVEVHPGQVTTFAPRFEKSDTSQPALEEGYARVVLDTSESGLTEDELSKLVWIVEKSGGLKRFNFEDGEVSFYHPYGGTVDIMVSGLPEGVTLTNGENFEAQTDATVVFKPKFKREEVQVKGTLYVQPSAQNEYREGLVAIHFTNTESGETINHSADPTKAYEKLELPVGHYSVAVDVPDGYTKDAAMLTEIDVESDFPHSFGYGFVANTAHESELDSAHVVLDMSQMGLSADELKDVHIYLVGPGKKDERHAFIDGTLDLQFEGAASYSVVAEGLPEGLSLDSTSGSVTVFAGDNYTYTPKLIGEHSDSGNMPDPGEHTEALPANEATIEVVMPETDLLTAEEFKALTWSFEAIDADAHVLESDANVVRIRFGAGEAKDPAGVARIMSFGRLLASVTEPAHYGARFRVSVEGLPEGIDLAEESRETDYFEGGHAHSYTPHFVRSASTHTEAEGEAEPATSDTPSDQIKPSVEHKDAAKVAQDVPAGTPHVKKAKAAALPQTGDLPSALGAAALALLSVGGSIMARIRKRS